MEIKDLKVGQKFYIWYLGYGITSNDEDVPKEMRQFYKIFTIEKVNKVTFIANGVKHTSVPGDWEILNIDKMKRYILTRIRRYMGDVDVYGKQRCTYYNRYYTEYLKTLTKEEIDEIMNAVTLLARTRLTTRFNEALETAIDQATLIVGRREKRWDER